MGILNKLLGSSNSSNQEKEEEEKYLLELKRKERDEIAALNKEIVKQGGKYAWRGAIAVGSGAVALGSGVGRAAKKGIEYTGSTEIGKYAKSRAKGAVEYIPETFSKLTEDYEAGRISKKIYDDAYRQHKIDLAKERGRTGEQQAYRKSKGEDSASIKKRKIESDAKAAYATTKAKSLARLSARAEFYSQRQQETQFQQQFVRPIQRTQQRRMVNFYSLEGARAVDPLGILSISQSRQQQPQQFQQLQQQQLRPSMDHMNMLLGFSGTDKTGKRRKVYNIFLGIWE
jgi:hypothetical protein